MCGFQARGSEDEVVRALQEHGAADHGGASSREKLLASAVRIPDTGDGATA
jgi:predicted small metal-binding protein